jgi:ATP-binding cassette subfamily F protein 3
VLSGGEKSRVALAKTLISEANFLLLDEPTNHLDFISENILIQALQQYQGSFVVVSHNRHFVSQVANKIWYIENHEIKEYLGTYDEYEYWRKKKEAEALPPPPASKKQAPKPQEKSISVATNPNAKKISDLNRELKKVEDAIHLVQLEKEKIEAEMALPEVYGNFEKLNDCQQKYEKIDLRLEEENKKWESLAFEIEELEKK